MVVASDEVGHVLRELQFDPLALIQEFKMAVHCLQAISKALQGLLKKKGMFCYDLLYIAFCKHIVLLGMLRVA